MYSSRKQRIEDISFGASSSSILPKDSISHTSWLDKNIFGVTSFDGYFRMYEINFQAQNYCFDLVFQFKYDFPLTHFTFVPNSTFLVLGTCDGKVLLVDYNSSQNTLNQNFKIIDEFSNPVLKVFYVEETQTIICTDCIKTCHYIDLVSMNVEGQYITDREIMDCDVQFPYFVIALSDNHLDFVNAKSFQR